MASLPDSLDAGVEVDRSLWDYQSLIADIDLEYHNFDNPATPWLDPERAFDLQQPVLDATLRILSARGIAPLVLMSGRGYHLVWSIHRGSRAFRSLVRLGRIPPSLEARYASINSPDGSSVTPDFGQAYAGLGMVMEFVWTQVAQASQEAPSAIPIQPAAIEVGPGVNGREIISFDLSEYGDPLHSRHIRLPFSAYLKPRRMEWMLGEEGVRRLLPIFEVPCGGMTPAEAIATARDPAAVLELARDSSVAIPDYSAAMDILLNGYKNSEVAEFHERFYGEPWEPRAQRSGPGWEHVSSAPPCVEWVLEHPNDWLLKPAALQHISRVLTALDWAPLSIAHLICAGYRKDANWGDFWTRLDPCNRAIFYTRLFAGMIATGVDRLIDLNCVSHREKGYCVVGECHSNLVPYRDALLERRFHERLGGGPFDRMLLADQHF